MALCPEAARGAGWEGHSYPGAGTFQLLRSWGSEVRVPGHWGIQAASVYLAGPPHTVPSVLPGLTSYTIGWGGLQLWEEVAPPAAHWEWNPPCKEPGGGRPQPALTPRVYTRALLPSLSLCFSFLLGQMNVWGKICNLEQPQGGDEGDLEDAWLLVSAHLLWPTLDPYHSLPPASLVYTSWPESLP